MRAINAELCDLCGLLRADKSLLMRMMHRQQAASRRNRGK
jgi:hypothetical protein